MGDRVLVDGLLAGPRSLGDHRSWGGFASYAVAPVEAVHRVPGDLSFDPACNLLGHYETAHHCLVTRGRLQPGQTVLIHGASGATSLAAVHLAKRLGATVIATGRSAEKLAAVQRAGADHVIVTRDADGARPFRDEVKALTGGRGVDVVYDGVGGDASVESLRCVRFGARYLVVGGAATSFVARGSRAVARWVEHTVSRAPTLALPHEWGRVQKTLLPQCSGAPTSLPPLVGAGPGVGARVPNLSGHRSKGQRGAPNANQLPTNLIRMKGLDVLGCPTVISTVHDPSLRPPRLAYVLAWAAEGTLRPHVSRVFRLAEYREAMQTKWRGDVVGGCVRRP